MNRAVGAALLLAGLSLDAGAEWRVEKVSDGRFGPLTIGRVGSEHRALYAASAGYAGPSAVSEIVYRGNAWQEREIYMAPSPAHTLAIGPSCGPSENLAVKLWDGAAFQLWPGDGKWVGIDIRDTWRRTDIRPPLDSILADAREAPLGEGATLNVAFMSELNSSAGQCRLKSIHDVDRTLHLRVKGAGDFRGDGVRRFVGAMVGADGLYKRGGLVELTPGRPWKILPIGNPKSIIVPYVAGEGRGDGRQSIYVWAEERLIEMRWNGEKYEEFRMGTYHFVKMIIGAFRSDGRKRVYVASGEGINEFSYLGDAWWPQTIHHRKGFIQTMTSGVPDGRREESIYFSILNAGGLYRLAWDEGDRIAVAPFGSEGMPAAESAAFADILRTRLIELGNCSVVEREEMIRVLAEQKFQMTPLANSEYAVAVGKLLSAKKVVVGTTGAIYDGRAATINSVSVKDHRIEHSHFAKWASAAEMHGAAVSLASKICPLQAGE